MMERIYDCRQKTITFTANFDFFQPFKHVKGYSVSSIYCVILNLPWSIQYLKKKGILIGLIPGPKEPDHNINTFLNPLVEELKTYWEGVE